jgi:AraC family ethanolamine operon transcriptional activator
MTDGRDHSTLAPGQRARDPWAYASQYDDIDAQAAHFEGFGQHYEQLSAGPFRGYFESYQFGRQLTVHLECANRKLMQCASTPAERFGFSIVAPESPACVLNGHRVGAGDIIVYPAGTTIEGTTPEGMKIFCVDMEADRLAEYGLDAREIRVFHEPDRTGDLQDVIVSGIAAFTRLGAPEEFAAAAGDFCTTLSELVWQLSSADGPEPVRARRRGRREAYAVFHRARDMFIERLACGLTIVDVCREVGVSRRSLECAFRMVIGMGPAHYVRKLQLNRVRRDLLCGADPGSSIGVIAARHGVWHWSRFSQNYRAMFGELPSETRRRARAGLIC